MNSQDRPFRVQSSSAPRRAEWGVVIAIAVLQLFVFFCANFFSHGAQRHGWPFTYMTRESRVRGAEFSIFHGPWPFDNPPVISFHRWLLALDACVCGATLVLISCCVICWLRRTSVRLRFRLRSLFVLLTLSAVLAAAARPVWRDVLWSLGPACWLVAYAFPCIVAFVGTRCLVVTCSHSPRRTRWLGLHWVTWAIVAMVAGPLIYYAYFDCTGFIWVGREERPGLIMLSANGWPLEHAAELQPVSRQPDYLKEGYPVEYFDGGTLIVNCFVVAFIIVSTAVIVERWTRRVDRSVQATWTTYISVVLVAVLAICTLVFDRRSTPEWFALPSYLLGVACAYGVVAVLGIRAFAFLRGGRSA